MSDIIPCNNSQWHEYCFFFVFSLLTKRCTCASVPGKQKSAQMAAEREKKRAFALHFGWVSDSDFHCNNLIRVWTRCAHNSLIFLQFADSKTKESPMRLVDCAVFSSVLLRRVLWTRTDFDLYCCCRPCDNVTLLSCYLWMQRDCFLHFFAEHKQHNCNFLSLFDEKQ